MSNKIGEGWGATVEEADQQALAALISKISIAVSSDFILTEDEKTTNGVLDAQSYANLKVQTYSSATLTNTERLALMPLLLPTSPPLPAPCLLTTSPLRTSRRRII